MAATASQVPEEAEAAADLVAEEAAAEEAAVDLAADEAAAEVAKVAVAAEAHIHIVYAKDFVAIVGSRIGGRQVEDLFSPSRRSFAATLDMSKRAWNQS